MDDKELSIHELFSTLTLKESTERVDTNEVSDSTHSQGPRPVAGSRIFSLSNLVSTYRRPGATVTPHQPEGAAVWETISKDLNSIDLLARSSNSLDRWSLGSIQSAVCRMTLNPTNQLTVVADFGDSHESLVANLAGQGNLNNVGTYPRTAALIKKFSPQVGSRSIDEKAGIQAAFRDPNRASAIKESTRRFATELLKCLRENQKSCETEPLSADLLLEGWAIRELIEAATELIARSEILGKTVWSRLTVPLSSKESSKRALQPLGQTFDETMENIGRLGGYDIWQTCLGTLDHLHRTGQMLLQKHPAARDLLRQTWFGQGEEARREREELVDSTSRNLHDFYTTLTETLTKKGEIVPAKNDYSAWRSLYMKRKEYKGDLDRLYEEGFNSTELNRAHATTASHASIQLPDLSSSLPLDGEE